MAISGGFLAAYADRVRDPLYARAIVLDDGADRVAIAVVDTLMMSRELINGVKRRASLSTRIPIERMLVSATHTHSAPSVMGALGTSADGPYPKLLSAGIVEAIEQAARTLRRRRSAGPLSMPHGKRIAAAGSSAPIGSATTRSAVLRFGR